MISACTSIVTIACSTEAEMSTLEQSSAYQDMAREISQLISPDPTVPDAGKSEIVISSGEFTEELAALKMMEAYSLKHMIIARKWI
jgi:hypothetical protein